jgi:hypothetical protein
MQSWRDQPCRGLGCLGRHRRRRESHRYSRWRLGTRPNLGRASTTAALVRRRHSPNRSGPESASRHTCQMKRGGRPRGASTTCPRHRLRGVNRHAHVEGVASNRRRWRIWHGCSRAPRRKLALGTGSAATLASASATIESLISSGPGSRQSNAFSVNSRIQFLCLRTARTEAERQDCRGLTPAAEGTVIPRDTRS